MRTGEYKFNISKIPIFFQIIQVFFNAFGIHLL